MLPSEKLLFSRLEAAEILSLSVSTLDVAVARGMLRVRRVGKRVMFERHEIEKFSRADHPRIWPAGGARGWRGSSVAGRDCFDCKRSGRKMQAARFYKNVAVCQGCWERRSALAPKRAAAPHEEEATA
jgi:excisionase family DNA binding protein